MSLQGKTTEEQIYNFLIGKGLTPAGAAGLMGNLYAESALKPTNLQNSYEKKLGFTDDTYTAAVDSGEYKNFAGDSAGYGLAQWTYSTRKQGLLNFAKGRGASVGDLETQLEYLIHEMNTSFLAVLQTLKTADSVRAASDAVLLKFERPADQSTAAQERRAGFGQGYFDKYAGKGTGTATAPAGQAGTSGGSNDTGGAGSPANGKGTGKMNASELIKKLQGVVDNHATLYVMGCFGAPLTGANVSRYCSNHSYNKAADRTAMIKAAANKNPPVFGFDCVCLIKGILWGWTGDASKTYGGAVYASNAVPDIGADSMIKVCKDVSTDFGKIVPGEAVWLSGHIGVYIGGGKVIECTPAFKNCVQVTACLNIGSIAGISGRKWTKHGKLPYITYDTAAETPTGSATAPAGQGATSGGSSDTSAALAFSVGDVVRFTGAVHYTNANAATGPACKPGTAKVTAISKGAKHPYHLIKESGGGSTVYGWVDAADVQAVGGTSAGTGTAAAMRVGARVQYSGPLYRDSYGNGQGKTVNGTFTVKYYYPGRKCGVHIDGLGWVPESACSVIG